MRQEMDKENGSREEASLSISCLTDSRYNNKKLSLCLCVWVALFDLFRRKGNTTHSSNRTEQTQNTQQGKRRYSCVERPNEKPAFHHPNLLIHVRHSVSSRRLSLYACVCVCVVRHDKHCIIVFQETWFDFHSNVIREGEKLVFLFTHCLRFCTSTLYELLEMRECVCGVWHREETKSEVLRRKNHLSRQKCTA